MTTLAPGPASQPPPASFQALTRRHLLQASAITAAGGALATTTSAPAGAAVQRGTAAGAGTLPGLPAKHRLYYGAIISSTSSVTEMENDLGMRLGSRRNYFQPDNVAGLLRRAREDVATGRFSILSIKPPGTWKSVATRQHNAWLNQILDGLAALDAPMTFTVNHEPENDVGRVGSGMTPYWYKRMTRHIVKKAANRAPQVNVIQILMAWTFHPMSHRKPEKWLASSCRMFGMDAYNWWSPTSGSQKWVEFGQMLDRAKVYAGNRPIVVAEYGTRTDPDNPGRAATWMRDAYEYALDNNVIAMDYFNTAPPGIKEPFVLDAERMAAFQECLADSRSVSLQV